MLRAHDLQFGPQYINMANGIFEDMKAGGSPCGGIYWDKQHTYTNAIANELYLAVAASLANRMPSESKQYYLDVALNQWNWFKGSGMINSENLINDGLDGNCQNNGGSPVCVLSDGKFIHIKMGDYNEKLDVDDGEVKLNDLLTYLSPLVDIQPGCYPRRSH